MEPSDHRAANNAKPKTAPSHRVFSKQRKEAVQVRRLLYKAAAPFRKYCAKIVCDPKRNAEFAPQRGRSECKMSGLRSFSASQNFGLLISFFFYSASSAS